MKRHQEGQALSSHKIKGKECLYSYIYITESSHSSSSSQKRYALKGNSVFTQSNSWPIFKFVFLYFFEKKKKIKFYLIRQHAILPHSVLSGVLIPFSLGKQTHHFVTFLAFRSLNHLQVPPTPFCYVLNYWLQFYLNNLGLRNI